MNSNKVPKRRRLGVQVERIFERWLATELLGKKYWIIGGALILLTALIAIFLKTRI